MAEAGRALRVALLAPASVVHTARWANALADRGHAVHLFSLHPPRHPLAPGVTLHRLGPRAPMGYFAAAGALRRRLAAVGPDLLNPHYATGYGTLARLCGFRPWLLSVWGTDIYDFPHHSRWHHRLLVRNLRAADGVLATSGAMAAETARLAPGLPVPRRTPFGVALDRFQPPTAQAERASIRIGTVKGLAPAYGIDRLIRAFAAARATLAQTRPEEARRLELMIAGEGPQRRALERLARQLGVAEVVTFSGHIPHEQVPEYLAQLDIFAALSRSESFGVAVLEASACGLPVITTDVGGLPEVVQDGGTGFVVSDASAEEAAAAHFARLATAGAERRNLGQAGRAFVTDHYAWAPCVAQMEAAYRAVLSGGRGAEA